MTPPPRGPPRGSRADIPEVRASVIPEVRASVIPQVEATVEPTRRGQPRGSRADIPEVRASVIPEVRASVIPQVEATVEPTRRGQPRGVQDVGTQADMTPEVRASVIPEVEATVIPQQRGLRGSRQRPPLEDLPARQRRVSFEPRIPVTGEPIRAPAPAPPPPPEDIPMGIPVPDPGEGFISLEDIPTGTAVPEGGVPPPPEPPLAEQVPGGIRGAPVDPGYVPPEGISTTQQETRKVKETIVPRDPETTLFSRIPKERLGTTGKTDQQLREDIIYFYRTFPNELKTVKFDPRRKNRKYLEFIHRRLESKLRGTPGEEGDKKIGIVISGSDFIKDKLKEIIMENSIQGLSASDLIINIEGTSADAQREDAGAFEIKRAPDGKPAAEREPIYRLIPETQPEKPPRKGKIPTPVTKYRTPAQTAKRQFANDPFRSKQRTIKLKCLY